MRVTKTRDRILAGIAGAALLIYILACAGSSFSPDDSKVLYPSNDPTTGHPVLAIYDRQTRKSRALFVIPNDDAWLTGTAWTKDGARAVAIWTGNADRIDIASIPLGTSRPIRLFNFAIPNSGSDAGLQFLYWPPAVVGSSLFVSAGNAIHRFDLEYGREASVAVEGDPILFGLNDRVFYARGLEKATLENPDRMEFGIVDLRSLSLSPLYTMPWDDKRGIFGLSRDGKLLATVTTPETGSDASAFKIAIYENGQLRQSIPISAELKNLDMVSDLNWSGDSRKLYFSYRLQLGQQTFQYGIAEVPIGNGNPRALPLLTATSAEGEENNFGLLAGLSRDGRTLAAASTYLQSNRDEIARHLAQRLQAKDLALYLIDVASPEWKVSKVPIPPLAMPAAQRSTQAVAQPGAPKSPWPIG
jgi:hypothetical protein